MARLKTLLLALLGLGLLALGAAAGFWFAFVPRSYGPAEIAARGQPDVKNGAYVFAMAGCASCHAAKDAKQGERLKLGGGQELATPFGTFRVPNISPDFDTGIGRWQIADIVNAVTRGTAPDGSPFYPAFPYVSYSRLKLADAVDLAAYLKTLPAVSNRVGAHALAFPFNLRLGLFGWKLLYFNHFSAPPQIAALPVAATDAIARGRYIVEGPGHCGECHTPRWPLGGPNLARWLAGAPALEGKGRVPDITPHARALGPWSADDIAYYLDSGLTPDGDSVGGAMGEVVANLSQLTKDDRQAIGAYLKAIPAIPPPPKPADPPAPGGS
ncbi:MAG: cytochrome c [Ancalomicrobiaceae bacterium]|nr:cytochrome c [Ancalomicrobiaceae bacterium]